MKNNILILGSALVFMLFWWWLGEQSFISEMSEWGKTVLSLVFLAVLLTISYLIWKRD